MMRATGRFGWVAPLLCAAAVMGCSSDRERDPARVQDPGLDPQATGHSGFSEAIRASENNLTLQQRITLGSVGGFHEQDGLMVASHPLGRFDFVPRMSTWATDPIELGLGSASVMLSLQSAGRVQAELDHGRVQFRDVMPSTDLLTLAEGRRVEQVFVLREAGSPSSFAWRLEPGKDLTVPANVDGGVVIRDVSGRERLRIERAQILGADGAQKTASVLWRDGYLGIDASVAGAMKKPVVISVGFEAPELDLMDAPPAQIKARSMVLIDTSGSMGYYFKDPSTFPTDLPGGDGSTSYTDKNVTNVNLWPGKLQGNVRQGSLSRMYAAKKALSNAVNGYSGSIDFGLETFDFNLCSFAQPRCERCYFESTTQGLLYTCLYADNNFTITKQGQVYNMDLLNWQSTACDTGAGGKIVAMPAEGSGVKVLPWVDGIEDHRASNDGNNAYGTGSTPINPEIRAEGSTPLAQAMRVARTQWFEPIKNGNLDPKLSCRNYSLIVLTDGVQSGTGIANHPCYLPPDSESATLYAVNPTNPVKTYVIGVSITNTDKKALNDIAKNGGTTAARFADDQNAIEAAFADIAASSVKYESCNGADDTCNDMIDEGMGVFQECTATLLCKTGSTCSSGRCTCTSDSQCNTGFGCAAGFCRPSCSVGVGKCLAVGVRKCDAGASACCVNDGLATCTPLAAGTASVETCNGIDDDCDGLIDDGGVCQQCNPTAEVCDGKDNDCDNIIDNHLVDTNQPCGYTIGVCKPGVTACNNGVLSCTGGVQPSAETCNGFDDDCNGIVDGMKGTCYTGPSGTRNVGICVDGQWTCDAVAGSGVEHWTTCVGQITPLTETCNGLDDNCNGVKDDVPGANSPCCPSNKCGTGICKAGLQQCSGGALQCIGYVGPGPELCNGLDDDCNGTADDIAGLGTVCCPSNKCGTGACKSGTLGCGANGVECVGAVNPSAEQCDLIDNDCNGIVDDVPGKGQVCCPSGACGTGICTSGILQCTDQGIECVGAQGAKAEQCNGLDDDCNGVPDDVTGKGEACCPEGSPAGNAPDACNKGICKPGIRQCSGADLVCVGGKAPDLEICDGIDNDCDGEIDDAADVATNDPAIGKECNIPEAPNDGPPCKAGKTVCKGAKPVCEGAVQPKSETCDGIDDNCNGQIDDDATCPPNAKCLEGICAYQCKGAEFPCPGGFVCKSGYCMPAPKPDAGPDTGTAGNAGDSGQPDAKSEAAAGGKGGAAGAGGKAGAPPDGGGGSVYVPPEQGDDGGCGCRVADSSSSRSAWLMALVGIAALVRRRGGAR